MKEFEIYWSDLSDDCQKRLYEFLGGNNGNYDIIPLTVVMGPGVIRVEFCSVWDDGDQRIVTDALYEPETGIVFNVDTADVSGVDNLCRQYVVIDNTEYDVEDNEDGTYTVIR